MNTAVEHYWRGKIDYPIRRGIYRRLLFLKFLKILIIMKRFDTLIAYLIKGGEYFGIAIDSGRISVDQMTKLKAKLEATKAKLEAQNLTGLTKDDILGDLLYTTALSYFAELDTINYVQSKTMGIADVRLPSEAAFSTKLTIYTIFGIPQSVSAEGLAMDVARNLSARTALNGENGKIVQFVLSAGMTSSALEHSVPEQLFSTPDNPAHGISAMKALQIANNQGIPIYTVNQANINTILPQLQVDADVKADIQNSINAGKTVTVSKTNINFNGWTGCGYIIIDPTTGDAAYMINGGLSGAWLYIAIGNALIVLGLATSEFGAGIALLALGILYVGIGLCILNESDVPFQIALAAVNTIIAAVFVVIPGAGAFVASALITLVLTALQNHLTDYDIKTFCEGKS